MQREAIIIEHAYMSLLLRHFKDILCEVAPGEVRKILGRCTIHPNLHAAALLHAESWDYTRFFRDSANQRLVSFSGGKNWPLSMEVTATYFPSATFGQSCKRSKFSSVTSHA